MNDNKLIAEFMGYRLFGTKCRKPNLRYNLNEDLAPMQFHTSWDWLMPVVEKIEIEGFDPHGIIDNALGSREIEDVHNACVTLIKAYNNEEKENTKRVR